MNGFVADETVILSPDRVPPEDPLTQVAAYPAYIDRYRIDAVRGQGGMGIVYQGYDPQVERKVAIKAVQPGLLKDPQKGPLLRRLFKQELRGQGHADHPNIVRLYHTGEYQDLRENLKIPYLVMEYIEGASLQTLMEQRWPATFSMDEISPWIQQLLSALVYLHKHGWTHADIKPANLFVNHEGQIKLMDFGIARHAEAANDTRLPTGTVGYGAPEQMDGSSRLDGRADIYATGALVYALLTGKAPLAGGSLNNPVLSQCIGLSSDWSDWVERAMQFRPEDRFQTAAELQAAFEKIQQTPASATKTRKRWLMGIAKTLGLAAIVVAVIFVARPPEPDQPAPVQPENVRQNSDYIESPPVNLSKPVPLQQSDAEKAAYMISRAQQQIDQDYLVLPETDNAVLSYRWALRYVPDHPQALAGLENIARELALQIRQLQASGNTFRSQALLSQGLKYFPDDKALQDLLLENRD